MSDKVYRACMIHLASTFSGIIELKLNVIIDIFRLLFEINDFESVRYIVNIE